MGGARPEPGRPSLPSTNRAPKAGLGAASAIRALVWSAMSVTVRGGEMAAVSPTPALSNTTTLCSLARAFTNDGDQLSIVPPRPMMSNSGCPLPSSLYPTSPSVGDRHTDGAATTPGAGCSTGVAAFGVPRPQPARRERRQRASTPPTQERTRHLDHANLLRRRPSERLMNLSLAPLHRLLARGRRTGAGRLKLT